MSDQENTNTIPVVFCIGETYRVPAYVTAFSLIINARVDTFYDIYFLVSSDFSSESCRLLKSLEKINNNCFITVVDMTGKLPSETFHHEYISYQAYYRFFIPNILTEYEKAIYLDADLIVLSDLNELYDISLGEAWFSALLDGKRYYSNKRWDKNSDSPGLYINSGVLLLNCKKMRQENLLPRLLQHIPNEYLNPDQYILAVECKGSIFPLSLKFNYLMPYDTLYREYVNEADDQLAKEINDAIDNPCIIHFCTNEKPWISRNMAQVNAYYQIWWKYEKRIDSRIRKSYIEPFLRLVRNERIDNQYAFRKKQIFKDRVVNQGGVIANILLQIKRLFSSRGH